MYRRVFLVASAIVVFILACTAGGTTPQGEERVESGVSQVPEAPTQAPLAQEHATATVGVQGEETQTEEGVCQGDRWRIIPLAVYEYPQGDGWKTLLIPLAVENGSELWGIINDPLPGTIYLTTEDGYTYAASGGNYVEPLSNPTSPYKEVTGRSQIYIIDFLPPGFRAKGRNSAQGNPDYFGGPGSWSQLVFQVAETQKRYRVAFQRLTFICTLPGGSWGTETTGPIELDLESDVRSVVFPVEETADRLSRDPSVPFEIGDAELQITKVYRENTRFGDETGDMVVIEFQVANLSGGYEASGLIRSYLIGDDGLIRNPGCESGGICRPDWASLDFPAHNGFFQVGPGQTGEASIGFLSPRSVGDLKFVISDEHNVLWVYGLPDDF